MITLTISGESTESIRVFAAALLGFDLTAPVAPKAAKKSEVAESVAKVETTSTAKTDVKADTVENKPAAASNAPPTYKDVADLIPKLVAKHGKPKIVAFLESFGGAKNGKDLKVEQYAEFIAKAKAEFPL